MPILPLGPEAGAVDATPERRRAAERDATLSSCCGVLGEVTLTDSAVIILFAGMLGAGEMLSLLTTSLLPLLNGLCVIPMAWLAARVGAKRLMLRACALATDAYFLAVASPFLGNWAAAALLTTITLFALSLTGFIAGWFPTLDSFLAPERRGVFLGRMRFFHQLTAVAFLFLVGLAIGKNPPVWKLQAVLLVGAAIFLGRMLFIARIPVFATPRRDAPGFKAGLLAAIGNKPLTGFSLYLFVLNLAAYGTVPLTLLYLKKALHAPDNVIVIISALALFGLLLGYLGAGWTLKRWGTRDALLGFHLCFALVNLSLFFVGGGGAPAYALIAALLLVYSFAIAAASIVSSSEMMALAAPGNKTMAMAFCGAFYYGGSGLSRLVASLVLGAGLLAPEWHLGGMRVCHYQTLFLLYAVAVVFAAAFLVVVPAIFPEKDQVYDMR